MQGLQLQNSQRFMDNNLRDTEQQNTFDQLFVQPQKRRTSRKKQPQTTNSREQTEEHLQQFIKKVFSKHDARIKHLGDIQSFYDMLFERQFEPENDLNDFLSQRIRSQPYKAANKALSNSSTGLGADSENLFGSQGLKTTYDLVKMTQHVQNPPTDDFLNQIKKMDIDSVNYFIDNQSKESDSSDKNPFANPFAQGSIYDDDHEESKSNEKSSPDSFIHLNSNNSTKRLNYAQRSQLVGRLGPCQTQADTKNVQGLLTWQMRTKIDEAGNGEDPQEFVQQEKQQQLPSQQVHKKQIGLHLDLESKTNFATIRANTGVYKGKYYFEVQLLSNGCMQIGWSQMHCRFTHDLGVGDSVNSYAYDGFRRKSWNEKDTNYGEYWTVGDTIGSCIDLTNGKIMFWRNGHFLGTAFKSVPSGQNKVYFPTVSLQRGQRVVFNFGNRPFQNELAPAFMPLDAPACLKNRYIDVATLFFDTFVDFLVAFVNPDCQHISLGERLAVGATIMEYLLPLLEEPYIVEKLVIETLFRKLVTLEGIDVKKIRFAQVEKVDGDESSFQLGEGRNHVVDPMQSQSEWNELFSQKLITVCTKLFTIHLSDDLMGTFGALIFRTLARLSLGHNANPTKNAKISINNQFDSQKKQENFYLRVIQKLICSDQTRFLYAWLDSSSFFDDLTLCCTITQMSDAEWQEYLEVFYHALLQHTHAHKNNFNHKIRQVEQMYDSSQLILQDIFKMLMSEKQIYANGSSNFQEKGLVPRDKLYEFVGILAKKGKELAVDNNIYVHQLQVEMSNTTQRHSSVMLAVFVALETQLVNFLKNFQIADFPIEIFFLKELDQFEKDMEDTERLGGTLHHLERESKVAFEMFRLKQGQRVVHDFINDAVKLAKLILQLFNCGLLDHLKKFQSIYEIIFIKHRVLDDLNVNMSQQQADNSGNSESDAIQNKIKQQYLQLKSNIEETLKISPPFRIMYMSRVSQVAITRFCTWLVALVNNLDNSADQNFKNMVYAIPTLIVDIPFETFRAFKRAQQSDQCHMEVAIESDLIQDFPPLAHTSFQKELGRFVARHFFDAQIANPDLKETMIIRLNMFLQFQDCILTLEQDEYAWHHLAQMLLSSLQDRRWIGHSVKNLLRLSKGQGFKEIVYKGVRDATKSDLFMEEIRSQLLQLESEVTQNCLNTIFNAINDIMSELFMLLKDFEGQAAIYSNSQVLRKGKYLLDLTMDLSRVLEMIVRSIPEIFLTVDEIHSTRIMNFLMFVLQTMFKSNVLPILDKMCKKFCTKSRNPVQFLSPFIGILAQIYNGIQRLKPKQDYLFEQQQKQPSSLTTSVVQQEAKQDTRATSYYSLLELFNRMNQFDLTSFEKLQEFIDKEIVNNENQQYNQSSRRESCSLSGQEREMLTNFQALMTQLKQFNANDQIGGGGASQLLQHGANQEDSKQLLLEGDAQNRSASFGQIQKDEEDLDDERMCQICFSNPSDTAYDPCMHVSCKICIQTNMLNNKKCPFCQKEIVGLKKHDPQKS